MLIIVGWRWLFIIEGVATIIWACCAYFILLDFPANSKRLTDRERAIAIARLREGGVRTHAEGEERMGKAQSFKLAIMDWRTIGFILGYMVSSPVHNVSYSVANASQVIVGSSTLSYFYPTLVKGLGYKTTVQAQYMTVPIYAVAFVCTAVTTYFGDSAAKHRGIVISSWLTFSLITSILVCVIYNFTARYVLLVLMAAGLWSSNAMALSFASATFGSMEPEVRAIALALVNAFGNLAQIYGAYLFPSEDAPKYLMGFGVISGLLGFGVCVYIFLHVALRRKEGLGFWR
jgi:hypothetical protein